MNPFFFYACGLNIVSLSLKSIQTLFVFFKFLELCSSGLLLVILSFKLFLLHQMFEFHFSGQSRHCILLYFRHTFLDFFRWIHNHCSYNVISLILQGNLFLPHNNVRLRRIVFFSYQLLLAFHFKKSDCFCPGIDDIWLGLLGIGKGANGLLLGGPWVCDCETVHIVLN